jgi:hypothetical protein
MIMSQYDEILRAMDIVPLPTENFAGVCAVQKANGPVSPAGGTRTVIPIALQLCTDRSLGFETACGKKGAADPDNSPDEEAWLWPDMKCLGSQLRLRSPYKWFQAGGALFLDRVPRYNVDVVSPPISRQSRGHARLLYPFIPKESFRGLIAFLEKQTGRKMSDDRLWESIRLCDEAWRLWYEIDRLRVAVPSPMPSQDHFSIMAAAHYYAGTQIAVDFYQGLYDEVKYKAANKNGVRSR